MNLIIDIGNSFVKVAIMDGDEILWKERYSSPQEFDALAIKGRWPQIARAIVASTAVDTLSAAEALREAGIEVLEMNSCRIFEGISICPESDGNFLYLYYRNDSGRRRSRLEYGAH